MTSLTPEEQEQLATLQAKAAQAAWEENEAARVAKLAIIAPMAAALGTQESVNALVATLRQPTTGLDSDTAFRLDRLARVLSIDAVSVLYTAQQLAVPAPQPTSATTSTGSTVS